MNVTLHDPFGVTDDPKMEFLRQAFASTSFEADLRNAIPPNIDFRLKSIRVVRHRPGRRCLIEFDVQCLSPQRTSMTWIGKVRAKGVDRSTFALMQTLATRGFSRGAADDIFVPVAIAILPQWHMWLQEKVPGVTAMAALTQPHDPQLPRRIADALHKFHQTAPVNVRRHTIENELAILEDRLNDLARHRPRWSRRLDRVFAACEDLAGSLSESSTCGIHRDFHPDQVLVDGHRIWLLDLDLHSVGDPAVDAGNFLGHLAEFGHRHGDTVDALHHAALTFAAQFLRNTGRDDPHGLVVYGLLSFARLLGLSLRYPDRLPFAEQLLETCEGCLLTRSKPSLAYV